ncbi:MAG: hypothetical protein C7B45_11670 [Sulfobacillus acidophilus]|uniref:Type II secretion system protein GspF domain-containing protein n=1 Tax=Sulfobacillus acidophilus TaxID=53633 RepID=A0A2T2WGB9_9FIRM|nr:MAG: hypothetical protein C7B45_11670 [Sulfobacillus acidophilus]
MTTQTVMAIAAGAAVYVWLQNLPWWTVAVGWGFGLTTENAAIMSADLLVGLGLAIYLKARDYEVKRDSDEQSALIFLLRLRQLLTVRGTLAGALEEMGYRVSRSGSDSGEEVIKDVADQYRVASLTFVSRVGTLIRRHGGSLQPLLDWAAESIQHMQSRRHARQLEEAAQRSTIIVLSLAPWGVIAIFRIMVPAFYRALTSSIIGYGALGLVGVTTFSVFVTLAYHMRKEAYLR